MIDEGEMFDWKDEAFEDRCLDLEGKDIGARDIGEFLKSLNGLKEVSSLKVVDISDNHVGVKNESMAPIDTLLMASSSTITALNLSSNPLGEDQRQAGPLVAFASTLENLLKLKVLDLSQCTLIGVRGHRYSGLLALEKAFAGRKNRLTHLRLCNNNLHSEAALIIGGWLSSLSRLRHLDLSRNPLARDALAQRSRTGFDFLCCGLRTLPHLRRLLLRDVGIDDGEAEAVALFLACSVRLETLDLSDNQMHVRGARHLAGALRSNGTLKALFLERNRIGDDGARLVANSIPYAESLVELNVSSNGLTVRIKEAFIEAALASVKIETYGLSGNDIPLAVVEEIQEYASANFELRAIANSPESYDLWKASSIVEACLVAKFDRLPAGVADVLKKNATFVEEDGPMREAVLAASPLTKSELMEINPGVIEMATKAKLLASTWMQSTLDEPQELAALDGGGTAVETPVTAPVRPKRFSESG